MQNAEAGEQRSRAARRESVMAANQPNLNDEYNTSTPCASVRCSREHDETTAATTNVDAVSAVCQMGARDIADRASKQSAIKSSLTSY